jgi:hypothetical protein
VADRIATILIGFALAYGVLGAAFSIAFVARGVDRIDPAARGAGWGFRLLILPGSALFWPLLARRWWTREPPPAERNAHRRAAGGVP